MVYPGLSNAWGYSRANVSDRARRRYGRRRRRHIRKMEGRMEGRAEASGRPAAPHGDIGAADAFVGNLHRNAGEDGKDALGGGASKGDIVNMNEE